MRRAALIVTLSLILPAALAAQTVLEAAAANVGLATQLCLRHMLERTAPASLFTQAGFVYRQTDRGTNRHGIHRGYGHYFDAPAQTAKIEVPRADQFAGLCTVTSSQMSEPQLASIVGGVVLRSYPNVEVRSPTEWIVRVGTNLPLIVSTTTIQRHRYEAPGTVSVSMVFPG